MASPTNSSRNGGIIGVCNAFTPASCTPIAANIVAVTATGCYSKPASHPGAGAVMLVAGGGGSSMEHAGGGGAGGVILNPSITLASGPIVIGAGGNGVAGCTQTSGNNTTGFSLTAIGGGHAGSYNATAEPGGSGGGGPNNSLVPTAAGTGTACQGNNGGVGSGCHGGGGGGGAAAVGAPGPGGAGGAGIDVTPVFGSAPQPFYIANGSCAGASVGGIFGGGGGGTSGPSTSGSSGGIGGGGDGTGGAPAPESGTSGIANTGGGGGGGRTASGGVTGGSGGAGYALIKEDAYNVPVAASAPGVWSMQSLYSNVRAGTWVQTPSFISATGGTRTEDGDYAIHTFTASGPFSVTAAVGKPTADSAADYLIVAGAGSSGSGNGNAPGGGGAGGVRASATTYTNAGPSSPRTAGVAAVTLTTQDYSIVVGAGDVGQTGPQPNPGTRRGTDSSGLGLTATGGGAGGYHGGGGGPGNSGGSGGGASGGGLNKTAGAGNTPPTSPAQGMIGGARPGSAPDGGGGSGGGFIGAGTNAGPAIAAGGAGGGFPTAFGANGEPCGSYRYYAGGGASDGVTPGTTPAPEANVGGVGGGGGIGQADGSIGVAGTANTGGGGGGPNNTNYPIAGANGGSGIVVIRYKFQ